MKAVSPSGLWWQPNASWGRKASETHRLCLQPAAPLSVRLPCSSKDRGIAVSTHSKPAAIYSGALKSVKISFPQKLTFCGWGAGMHSGRPYSMPLLSSGRFPRESLSGLACGAPLDDVRPLTGWKPASGCFLDRVFPAALPPGLHSLPPQPGQPLPHTRGHGRLSTRLPCRR